MRIVALIVVLLALGAGGAMIYLKASKSGQSQGGAAIDPASLLHGGDALVASAPKCAKHGIPEAVCAFCHPELVETLGFCHGHDVPEAFCTRCSKVLIPAFKVEGDWCEEHGLPTSQCPICKGESNTNSEQSDPGGQ